MPASIPATVKIVAKPLVKAKSAGIPALFIKPFVLVSLI